MRRIIAFLLDIVIDFRLRILNVDFKQDLMIQLTFVFVHGAGGGRITWRLQLTHFKNAHAVELPGHPSGNGYATIGEYADFVERFIETHDIIDPILVGHSMGGGIAIECALRNPKLTGLVLVGTGARLRVRQDLLTMILQNYGQASKLIAKLCVAPDCDPVIVQRLASELLKVKPEVVHGDFLACNRFDRMNEVQMISCPTMVVCGTVDQLTPFKYSEYLHQKIRNSRLLAIANAGHSVMIETHREFNSALENFETSLNGSRESQF
jgi:pimeloyl-ACP methyl ester carboxylesterase